VAFPLCGEAEFDFARGVTAAASALSRLDWDIRLREAPASAAQSRTLGAPLAVGAVTPDAVAPYMEVLDHSCAEVIRAFLRWTPDATAAFDYTTSPFPTLSIHRRGCGDVFFAAYGAPVSGSI